MLKEFKNSKITMQAQKDLYSALDTENLTRIRYCNIRDYLITNLALDNAQRKGALCNISVDDVCNAQEIQTEKASSYVILVSFCGK